MTKQELSKEAIHYLNEINNIRKKMETMPHQWKVEVVNIPLEPMAELCEYFRGNENVSVVESSEENPYYDNIYIYDPSPVNGENIIKLRSVEKAFYLTGV